MTTRRTFLTAATATASLNVFLPRSLDAAPGDAAVIGHGSHKYKVVPNWGVLDDKKTPVANCHEILEDNKGRIILFQTNAKNNVIVYDKSGKLLTSWGTEYPGAHGLDIVDENGEQFLFLTDVNQGKVFKTTLDGKVVMTLGRPLESGKYSGKEPYKPTNVFQAPDGTFFIGDGYGSSWILHYDAKGGLLNVFGGRGDKPYSLNTPHGGIVDTRDKNHPVVAVCSRSDNAVKRFELDGTYLSSHAIPGMRVCQLAQQGDYLYAPHLEGVISVIDRDYNVVSNPGGSAPDYSSGQPAKVTQTDKTFVHPHGIHTDADDSVYVAQWNSGNTYPIKLQRVS